MNEWNKEQLENAIAEMDKIQAKCISECSKPLILRHFRKILK